MFEFKLPDLGEGIHEGQIVNVLVKEGQRIEEFAPMLEVETDKAAVEIPSPKAGVVTRINVKPGQTVKVGEIMLAIDDGAGSAAAPKAAPAAAPAAAKAAAAPAAPPPAARSAPVAVAPPPPARPAAGGAPAAPAPANREGPIPAAPAVRKLAREMGVQLEQVNGTGPHGRVLKEDVERYSLGHRGGGSSVSRAVSSDGAPGASGGVFVPGEELPDFSQYGPIRREPISQIRKTIARQMTKSWLNVPRVTHGEEIDITELERNRKRYNEKLKDGQPKLSVTALVMKAVAAAIREFPTFNASFDHNRNEIIFKEYVNLGVAVDGPRGLVVPVVKDCHLKTLPQIAGDLNALAQKVRDGKIEINDMRGATFTVTNVGALGGTFATPMVSYPELAILGMAKASQQARVVNGDIVARLILPIFMSFDHRMIDGADAARFCSELKDMLENPLRLLSS